MIIVPKSVVFTCMFALLLVATSIFHVGVSLAASTSTAALLPTSEGLNLAWTPNATTTHYTTVDETVCNGTTDYVFETSVGDRESFGVSLATVPEGAIITNLAVTPCASRNTTGSGSSSLALFYRYNASTSVDTAAYILATGTTPIALAAKSFGGLALVKSSSSSLQVGAVYNAGNRGVRLSRLATVITYTFAVPTVPTNLIVLASSTASGTLPYLAWNDNSNDETGFRIERSIDNITFSQVALTSAGTSTYLDKVFSPGTYYYKVRAYNIIGNSGYTNTTSTTLP